MENNFGKEGKSEVLKTIERFRGELKEEERSKSEPEERSKERMSEEEYIAYLYSEVYGGNLSIMEFKQVLESKENLNYTYQTIRNKLIKQGVYESEIGRPGRKPKEIAKAGKMGKFASRRIYNLVFNDLISKRLKESKPGELKKPGEIWSFDEDELDDAGEITDQFLGKYLPYFAWYEERKAFLDFIGMTFVMFLPRLIDSFRWKRNQKELKKDSQERSRV